MKVKDVEDSSVSRRKDRRRGGGEGEEREKRGEWNYGRCEVVIR